MKALRTLRVGRVPDDDTALLVGCNRAPTEDEAHFILNTWRSKYPALTRIVFTFRDGEYIVRAKTSSLTATEVVANAQASVFRHG